MWSGIVQIGFVGVWVDNIMPVLVVQGDLDVCIHWSLDWWESPGPLIDIELLTWDLDFLGDWNMSLRIGKSYEKSIIQMGSSEHIAETLMPLEVGTIGWTSGWVEERCVRWLVEVEDDFLWKVADSFLLGELLSIEANGEGSCTWKWRLWSLEGHSLVGDVQWSDLDDTKSDDNSAGGVLVETGTVDGDEGATSLWTKLRRKIKDEWIVVVLESTI